MKSMDNITMISKGPSKLSMVSSKLSESSIEEKNPTSNGVSDSKSRMEEYNIAMKRMMRNPYEYHHDLGDFHFYHKSSCFLFLLLRCEFDFENPSSWIILSASCSAVMGHVYLGLLLLLWESFFQIQVQLLWVMFVIEAWFNTIKFRRKKYIINCVFQKQFSVLSLSCGRR